MATGVIEIIDEVNVRIAGVPSNLIKEASNILTWNVPGFRWMPKYRAGKWNGEIKLMSKTGKTFLNLLDQILPFFEENGYGFEIEDHRHDWSEVIKGIQIPDEHVFSDKKFENGDPIILRDYQMESIRRCIENGTGMLELATGSGKTLICATISKIYSEFGKVVIIVPSIDLVIQTRNLFQRCGLKVGVWYGEWKEPSDITISTWQSIAVHPEVMTDVICCIVDEAHGAKAKTIGNILSGPGANVPFRFGCTGTIPKEDLYRNQILGVLGETIFELKAWELQEKGILASSEIYQFNIMDSKHLGFDHKFDNWKGQLDWLFSCKDRLRVIGDIIKTGSENGNSIILVPYRKHGEALNEIIQDSVYIDGRKSGAERKKAFDWLNTGNNKILIATYGIASVGIDIPRIHMLGIIEPGHKFERVIQTIGRGLRKANDKQHLVIFDFSSDVHMGKRHASKRRSLYKQAKIDCKRMPIEYDIFVK